MITIRRQKQEVFRCRFESKIFLFEVVPRKLIRLNLLVFPSTKNIKSELNGVATNKGDIQSEPHKIHRKKKEYGKL